MHRTIYLDSAATTPLSEEVKKEIISLLDMYQNPSSRYADAQKVREIINHCRSDIARFINAGNNGNASIGRNIIFCSSGSAANTLAIKGLASDHPQLNEYAVYYSPTAHTSMRKACQSCLCHTPLKVTSEGIIDLPYLADALAEADGLKPLVCVEAANSEIGSINDVKEIGSIVHRHGGILLTDATGYIPVCRVDMQCWENVDILTFSGHKLHSLKGVGVLYQRNTLPLKPVVYGSQEQGLFGGTENVLGIASLGKALETYSYASVSPKNRDYVYNYIINHIPDSYLVGSLGNRLAHNLYICFQGVEGDALMLLLDMNGIQVSTGSACNSDSLTPSAVLSAIRMKEEDIHSCIRMTFSGSESVEDLDYVCSKLKECVETLRRKKDEYGR